jgi:flagellar operon protein
VNINNGSLGSIEQIRGKYLGKQENKNQDVAALKGNSFRDVLLSQAQKDEGTLKFSKHANERLASRNINLSNEQMLRLSEGTDRARQKGIKESLIVVDELAFIVNVKNNTVVTAVGDSEDKIFTNIDGAVIS